MEIALTFAPEILVQAWHGHDYCFPEFHPGPGARGTIFQGRIRPFCMTTLPATYMGVHSTAAPCSSETSSAAPAPFYVPCLHVSHLIMNVIQNLGSRHTHGS